jgi:hypothetical protein
MNERDEGYEGDGLAHGRAFTSDRKDGWGTGGGRRHFDETMRMDEKWI